VVLTSQEGVKIGDLDLEIDVVGVAKQYLGLTDLMFVILKDGGLRCFEGTTLKPRLEASCQ
jgi:hypothetical protein